MFDIDEIIDAHGEVRRLGSLAPPPNLVSAFPPFAGDDSVPLWDRSDILKAVRDSNRIPARVMFGPEWIQNQGSHGSCNGFAAAGVLARARWAAGIRDKAKFSGAYAYSLMNNGQDRGSILEDGMRGLASHGICLEATVGVNQIYRTQYDTRRADSEAAKHKGLGCYRATSKEAWDTGLATGLYFGVAAIQAGSNYQRPNANGISGADNGGGNHAIIIDGLAEVAGTLVYDNPGSWGLSLGGQGLGRVYLTWDSFAQTHGRHTFYLIPFAQELP